MKANHPHTYILSTYNHYIMVYFPFQAVWLGVSCLISLSLTCTIHKMKIKNSVYLTGLLQRINENLGHGLTYFFLKSQKAAYGPYMLYPNYSTLLLYHESSHRKCKNECAILLMSQWLTAKVHNFLMFGDCCWDVLCFFSKFWNS